MRALCACAFLCILLLGSSASADILVSFPDTSACPNDTLCVPITVGDLTGQNVIAFECSLSFDQTVVNAVSPYFSQYDGLVAAWTIFDTVNNAAGWLKIGGYSPTDTLAGDGQLLCLHFSVLPGAAGGSASSLTFSSFEFNEGTPAANTIDGSITARYPAPAQVTNVTTDDGCSRVEVYWLPASFADGHEIFRDDTLIGTAGPSQAGWDDIGASVGTHQYKVRAFNSCGDGPFSATVSGTCLTIPAAPSPVVASDTSCTGVWVTWQDVEYETSYQVNRGGVPIGLSLPANTTSYYDTLGWAGTQYEYIVLAVNACGNSGDWDLGVRLPLPGQPTGVQASDSGCEDILISWNEQAYVDSFQILRNGIRIAGVSGAWAFSDTDVEAGSCHAYTIVAYNRCGVSAPSLPDSGCRFRVPEIPTGLTATTDRCDSVVLNWNESARAALYHVVRFPPGMEICSVPAGVTRCADAPPGGTYSYIVLAWNTCGWGSNSDSATGTRLDVPPQVTGVGATLNRCDSIVVWWSDLADETVYYVYRNAGLPLDTLPANQTHFADAPPPGNYLYSVCGGNQCGAGALSAEVNGSRLSAPSQPTNVSASDTSCFYVNVSWTAVGSAADSFQIRRDGSRVGVAAGIADSYFDLTAVPGVTCAYTVVPYNSCGAGPASLPDNGFRLPAPTQVTGVTATDNRCDSVIVTWTDLSDETYYRVYRNGEAVVSPPANQTHFADAPASGTYSYQVLGGNACGDGPISLADNGTRLQVPGMPTGVSATDNQCGQVTITWVSGGGDVDSFKVFRNGNQVGEVPGATLSFTDTVTGTHAYTVSSHSNECNDGPISAADSGRGHAAAGVPTGLAVVTPFTCDSIRLSWTAASGEVAQYDIMRDDVRVDSTAETHYTDLTVDDAQDHVYRIRAMNPYCGVSNYTPPVTGHERRLVALLNTLADTLPCSTLVHLQLSHCENVLQDSFFLSMNGGPFEPVWGESPPVSDAWIPIYNPGPAQPNTRLMIVSDRTPRYDTLITDPFFVDSCISPVGDFGRAGIPDEFCLDPNFPNPFNPSTVIRFGVPQTAQVRIDVFDVLGRLIATPVLGTCMPGVHDVVWDCASCPSGMYVVRMQAAGHILMGKMLLMK